MSRHFDPAQCEWIADAAAPTDKLHRDLDSLIAIHRAVGVHHVVRHFLQRWLNPGRCYRILDVCTGAGDVARLMVEWARSREITLRVDAVESHPGVLEVARKRSADFPEIHFQQSDVLLEEPGTGYDLVHCSFGLHRFSDRDAGRLLIRCRELSTRWTLVSDLERHPFTTATLWTLTNLVHRSAAAAHDCPIAARHSFSYQELRELAEAAGWQSFGQRRMAWCCQALWLENRDLGEIPLATEMPSLA